MGGTARTKNTFMHRSAIRLYRLTIRLYRPAKLNSPFLYENLFPKFPTSVNCAKLRKVPFVPVVLRDFPVRLIPLA